MAKDIYKELSEERKRLQKEGLVPEWYTTGGYQMFKQKYSFIGNERSVRGQYERIAKAAAKHLKGTKWEVEAEGKFFDLLWKGWLSPSTPVLANMGGSDALPVSCSGGVIDDSILGFYENRLETAVLTKNGFGTSSYLGNIRPRGSKISGGGKASGVMPVLKGHIQDMQDVSQAGVRRGSWAGYIEIDHGDFDEIAHFILSDPDDCNIGWIITDDFISRLNGGDQEAIRRFKLAMKVKMTMGKGYFFFVDKVNRKRPQMYKDHGLTVKASNLCVVPETLILTDMGHLPIGELEGQKVNVWNGEEFAPVTIAKTGEGQEILKVVLCDGRSLECTEYHKFFLEGVDGTVRAASLKSGDRLLNWKKPDGSFVDGGEVSAIVYEGRVSDTYCFHEPKREMGVFNGILTSQCSEITLFSDKDHAFQCILSSMNNARWDEWKDSDAPYWATIFLDCVCEELILRGSKIKGIERVIRSAVKGRALGLGQCGLHTLFMEKMMPFESLEAQMLSQQITKHIREEADRATRDMAVELGEPEWCRGYGVRNTHLLTVPPTKSTALLLGGISEGINPDPAMTYTQKTSAGEVTRIQPTLLRLMKERGVYDKKHLTDITEKYGSVQHVDWLTDEEKKVFKTAFEMDQNIIIRMAAARGKYLDQWQSVNLFFSAEEDPKVISRVHQRAFLNPDILGLYYIYTQAGVTGAKQLDVCEACQ